MVQARQRCKGPADTDPAVPPELVVAAVGGRATAVFERATEKYLPEFLALKQDKGSYRRVASWIRLPSSKPLKTRTRAVTANRPFYLYPQPPRRSPDVEGQQCCQPSQRRCVGRGLVRSNVARPGCQTCGAAQIII